MKVAAKTILDVVCKCRFEVVDVLWAPSHVDIFMTKYPKERTWMCSIHLRS